MMEITLGNWRFEDFGEEILLVINGLIIGRQTLFELKTSKLKNLVLYLLKMTVLSHPGMQRAFRGKANSKWFEFGKSTGSTSSR